MTDRALKPNKGARLIQVIETTLTVRGGLPAEQEAGDTARRVTQYWTLDGELLAEVDPDTAR